MSHLGPVGNHAMVGTAAQCVEQHVLAPRLQISCKEGAIVGGILLGYLVSYLVVEWTGR